MTSILNATTTTGVQLTPDNSGVLQIQTGGAAAITISGAQQVSLANPIGATVLPSNAASIP